MLIPVRFALHAAALCALACASSCCGTEQSTKWDCSCDRNCYGSNTTFHDSQDCGSKLSQSEALQVAQGHCEANCTPPPPATCSASTPCNATCGSCTCASTSCETSQQCGYR